MAHFVLQFSEGQCSWRLVQFRKVQCPWPLLNFFAACVLEIYIISVKPSILDLCFSSPRLVTLTFDSICRCAIKNCSLTHASRWHACHRASVQQVWTLYDLNKMAQRDTPTSNNLHGTRDCKTLALFCQKHCHNTENTRADLWLWQLPKVI